MIILEQEIKPFLHQIGKTKNIFTIKNEDEKKHISYSSLKYFIGLHIVCSVPVIEKIDGNDIKNIKHVLVKINAFDTDEEIKKDIINQVIQKLNEPDISIKG